VSGQNVLEVGFELANDNLSFPQARFILVLIWLQQNRLQ
jgi:hypothetical protein